MQRMVLMLATILALTASAAAEDIAPERILAAAVGDWDKDGNPDLALLVAPKSDDDMIGIYIYLRDKDHTLLKLAAAALGKVAGNASLGSLVGQDPTISALPNGSIAVHSENSGVGRDRWEQTLTIAYRNAAFIVAGFTYSHNDTLEPDNGGACDYNVLSGKVSRNGKNSKIEAKTVKIGDWADALGMTACGITDD
jgi:hypothetical protein